MSRVAVVGSGGHSRALVSLLLRKGFEVVGLYDDSYEVPGEEILGIPLVGKLESIPLDARLVLACGDNAAREGFARRFSDRLYMSWIADGTAFIDPSAEIGPYCQVFPMAVVSTLASLGSGCIVNSGAVIEHECAVGDFCHVSVNSTLSGRVRIGARCFIGAGAVVRDRLSICDDVVVGAGAAVVASIDEPGVYVGVPARRRK